MNSAERQQAIAGALIERRHETVANLCIEFGVSRSTILRDITAITCSLPVETVRGRTGGGIRLCDWFHPSGRFLAPEQAAAIRRAEALVGDRMSTGERQALLSILTQFGAPV